MTSISGGSMGEKGQGASAPFASWLLDKYIMNTINFQISASLPSLLMF